MGAYLSIPVTETVTEDGCDKHINYGASSMQGWRVSQEDAHSAILNYDTETSFFAVFDGHGGPEVAKYCSQRLPQFIKSTKSYENGNFSEALEQSFLEFDASLLKPEVIEELKFYAETNDFDKNDENDDEDDEHEDEASLLRKEADIPIEDLMARYNKGSLTEDNEVECSSSSNIKFKMPLPSHLKHDIMNSDKKPLSPYLRAKNNRSIEGDEEMCSSSTCGSTSNIDDVSNSDNNCISQPDSTNKIDSESLNEAKAKPEECDKYKSIQLSNGETTISDTNLSDNDICQSSHSSIDKIDSPDNVNEITTSNEESSRKIISSDNSNDNNDDINSSSHLITNADTSNNNNNNTNSDSVNDGISSAVSSVSLKGKGKQRKIIPPKRKCLSSVTTDEDDSGPIYKSFLRDFDDSDDSDDSHDDYIGDVSDDDDEEEEELDDEDEESSDDELDDESGFIVQSSGAYEEPGRDSGCTAVVALLRGNNLYVANAGDSRCVVSRNGRAIEMSDDHKPEDEAERSRVERAGGKVTPDGRVNGGLNLSRAIGDHAYKDNHNLSARQQMITALPDVKTLSLDFSKDHFMVLACDGIWNSLTSQQVIDFIEERINKAHKLSSICDDLFNNCLASNTMGDGTGCDNMTCIIVKFNEFAPKRKLSDDYDESTNKVDTSITSDGPEPESKRIKTDDLDNDREINSTEVQV